MDNTPAVSSANYSARRVPQLAVLARGIKTLEVTLRCTTVAFRIAGRGSAVADALSRFFALVRGQGPSPGRELPAKFREVVEGRRGPMDVDIDEWGR